MEKIKALFKSLQFRIEAFKEQRKVKKQTREHLALHRQFLAIELQDRAERARIAQHFNHRYSYGTDYVKPENDLPGDAGMFGLQVRDGNRWMCPECNQIHKPLKFSWFVGVIYPACCGMPEGSRQDKLGKGFDQKRPIDYAGMGGLYLKAKRAGVELPEPFVYKLKKERSQ